MSGSRVLAAARFAEIQTEQWISPEALAHKRRARLRRIVRHAWNRSPFYRRRFEAAGLDPALVSGIGDLARLPLLRKADIRRPEEIIARGFDAKSMPSSFTSGSTGEGARTYFDPEGWMIGKYLLKLRARVACGVRPWDRIAQFQWIPGHDSFLRRHVLRQRSFAIDRDPEDLVAAAARVRPSVIYGFPGQLVRLGRAARGRLRPRLVFTSGEMLSTQARGELEASFGAHVFDVYGCTEMKEIAWECPEHAGYHMNADWLEIEVLRESFDGAPVGSIVVTSLFNRGMPLLRYLVGDAGRFMVGACPCGRGLPLLSPETGRFVDYVRLPSGSDVSPYTVMTPVEARGDVAQFEILQTEIDRLVVRVVPAPSWDGDSEGALRRELAPIVPGLEIDVHLVEEIMPERTGKYRIVRSRVSRPEPLS